MGYPLFLMTLIVFVSLHPYESFFLSTSMCEACTGSIQFLIVFVGVELS
jgi:hypothetical protein